MSAGCSAAGSRIGLRAGALGSGGGRRLAGLFASRQPVCKLIQPRSEVLEDLVLARTHAGLVLRPMNRNVKRRAREQEGAIAQAIDAVLDLLVELARLIGGHGRLVLFKIVQLSLQRIDILFDRAELL